MSVRSFIPLTCFKKLGTRRDSQRMRVPKSPLEFNDVFSRDSLFRAICHVQREGGPGAGEELIGPRELSGSEVGEMARSLSRWIVEENYVHGQTRVVEISKGPGRGMRRINVPNLADRVVGTCLLAALQPICDSPFLSQSVGCRRGRSYWDGLAQVALAAESGFRFMVKADLSDAFGHVSPLKVLESSAFPRVENFDSEDDHRRFCNLAQDVLAAGRSARATGIIQGSPFSPLALNLVLHSLHDLPLQALKNPCLRWVRFVDDCGYLASIPSQLLRTAERAAHFVERGGFRFKEECRVINLGEEEIEFLGVMLRLRDNKLTFRLTAKAKSELRTGFDKAMMGSSPLETARSIAQSWSASYALVPFGEVSPIVLREARKAGFAEIKEHHFCQAWDSGQKRWQTVRKHNGPSCEPYLLPAS